MPVSRRLINAPFDPTLEPELSGQCLGREETGTKSAQG